MRFFNSTVYPQVYGGRYFITDKRFDQHHPERFTIRVALAGSSSCATCGSSATNAVAEKHDAVQIPD